MNAADLDELRALVDELARDVATIRAQVDALTAAHRPREATR